ncbi:hypothetical protein Agabi119p4_5735 [Agaricus bisporus var. burnettii]|uniref:Uncharacterized protein n=1 Tax=Agaricus bisporus var. burnettii TaxID=192524 RepID=A0A8H7F265_AGABI|nr:hypothetical protein Agabi119p4_5735 [Agaricus bisporus var. burnettii]
MMPVIWTLFCLFWTLFWGIFGGLFEGIFGRILGILWSLDISFLIITPSSSNLILLCRLYTMYCICYANIMTFSMTYSLLSLL